MVDDENRFLAGIGYLAQGNDRQRSAYRVLKDLQVMERLHPFHPVLVGTIPIGIDVAGSDLDIICQVEEQDRKRFEETVRGSFWEQEGFAFSSRMVDGVPRQVGRFWCGREMVELFGQPVPVREQNGYRHMVVEHRILELLDEEKREEIRRLKRQGIKTEPAFGQLLRLEGDPYRALLEMYLWDDKQLGTFVAGRRGEGG